MQRARPRFARISVTSDDSIASVPLFDLTLGLPEGDVRERHLGDRLHVINGGAREHTEAPIDALPMAVTVAVVHLAHAENEPREHGVHQCHGEIIHAEHQYGVRDPVPVLDDGLDIVKCAPNQTRIGPGCQFSCGVQQKGERTRAVNVESKGK